MGKRSAAMFERLLRGEVSSREYVAALRADVAWRRAENRNLNPARQGPPKPKVSGRERGET